MFKLKDYQDKALDALDGFFRRLRSTDLETAWREHAPVQEKDGQPHQAAYSAESLGEVPAVCVRIPTGGGKTFLAAHAVARVGKSYCGTDVPVVQWLEPSDPIRTQTLAGLATSRHPCREALTEHLYKGEPYKTNDDSREKAQVGHQWESSSGGCCLFLLAVAQDEQGRDVAAQIENRIEPPR